MHKPVRHTPPTAGCVASTHCSQRSNARRCSGPERRSNRGEERLRARRDGVRLQSASPWCRCSGKIVDAYHARTASTCAGVRNCLYDRGALQRMTVVPQDLSPDANHLSIRGQRKMAAVTWTALYRGPSLDIHLGDQVRYQVPRWSRGLYWVNPRLEAAGFDPIVSYAAPSAAPIVAHASPVPDYLGEPGEWCHLVRGSGGIPRSQAGLAAGSRSAARETRTPQCELSRAACLLSGARRPLDGVNLCAQLGSQTTTFRLNPRLRLVAECPAQSRTLVG